VKPLWHPTAPDELEELVEVVPEDDELEVELEELPAVPEELVVDPLLDPLAVVPAPPLPKS
jgi:hypothetical protein